MDLSIDIGHRWVLLAFLVDFNRAAPMIAGILAMFIMLYRRFVGVQCLVLPAHVVVCLCLGIPKELLQP